MPNPSHAAQYKIAATLAVVFAVLYAFAPHDRSESLLTLTTACLTFILGKFTNGYHRPDTHHPAVRRSHTLIHKKEVSPNEQRRVYPGRR